MYVNEVRDTINRLICRGVGCAKLGVEQILTSQHTIPQRRALVLYKQHVPTFPWFSLRPTKFTNKTQRELPSTDDIGTMN